MNASGTKVPEMKPYLFRKKQIDSYQIRVGTDFL